MKLITKDLASQMEGCIKQTHIEVTKQYPVGKILEINGGAACFSGIDSYLSQVVGWGFSTKTEQLVTEIKAIEDFYRIQKHTRVDIELCPFTGNELAVFLSKRGYRITELNNVSTLYLPNYHSASDKVNTTFMIREVEPHQLNAWSTRVALGFGYPEAQKQFYHFANAKGATAFAVYDQGLIVAGALIATHGDFCDLGVTSTLPAYRGKGLQKLLLKTRLNFAKEQGVSWAMVTTEPGTVSDANVQKTGFSCAYTRVKLTLELNKQK